MSDRFSEDETAALDAAAISALSQYARYENAETSPPHYVATDLQPIQAIEGLGLGDGFELGNTIKYIARHERKGTPPQDIDKALCYLLRYRERRWGRIETIGEIRVTAPLTLNDETLWKTTCNDIPEQEEFIDNGRCDRT